MASLVKAFMTIFIVLWFGVAVLGMSLGIRDTIRRCKHGNNHKRKM